MSCPQRKLRFYPRLQSIDYAAARVIPEKKLLSSGVICHAFKSRSSVEDASLPPPRLNTKSTCFASGQLPMSFARLDAAGASMPKDANQLTCQEFQLQMAEASSGLEIKDLYDHPHAKTCSMCHELLLELETIAEAARYMWSDGSDDWSEST
jgi:hypothetical protein